MDERLIRDISILTDLMEQGGWKSLRVAGSNIELRLSQDDAEVRDRSIGPAVPKANERVAPAAVEVLPESRASTQIDPAWAVVAAPNLGTFYRSPKPGAPVFVEVGQQVPAGAELCLIEVMKLFTSVRADIAGTVRHIAVDDGQLVEGGQPLMYIEPR